MAHSEIYPNGKTLIKFFESNSGQEMADKFSTLSHDAFLRGAERVEQHVIHGNEPCPMCDSGIRFDLCCGKMANSP